MLARSFAWPVQMECIGLCQNLVRVGKKSFHFMNGISWMMGDVFPFRISFREGLSFYERLSRYSPARIVMPCGHIPDWVFQMLMIPVPFVEPFYGIVGSPKRHGWFCSRISFFPGETISNEPTHFEDMFSDGAKKTPTTYDGNLRLPMQVVVHNPLVRPYFLRGKRGIGRAFRGISFTQCWAVDFPDQPRVSGAVIRWHCLKKWRWKNGVHPRNWTNGYPKMIWFVLNGYIPSTMAQKIGYPC